MPIFRAIASLFQDDNKEPMKIAPPTPPPPLPELPAAPTPEDAEAKAREEAERQKRIRLLAGGKTILASEGPILSSSAGKTLLGA